MISVQVQLGNKSIRLRSDGPSPKFAPENSLGLESRLGLPHLSKGVSSSLENHNSFTQSDLTRKRLRSIFRPRAGVIMADSSPRDADAGASFYPWFLQWRRTSFKDLENIDKKILDSLPCIKHRNFVSVGNYNRLWSITCNPDKDKTPVVMVHGMGGGVGLWAMNLEALSRNRPVYAFDVLGFGRSSRPTFSVNSQEAEETFIESIESYRKAMGLERFILLGHSLGGFLSASYSLRYPQYVKHLILVDPWGMSRRPAEGGRPIPFFFRVLLSVVNMGYPMSVLRVLGPFGPGLVKKYRPQLAHTFGSKLGDDSLLHDYIYHCNAQDPSGEVGFKSMSEGFGWAKEPMIERMTGMDPNVPITFVYGAESWVDRATGLNFKNTHSSYVDVQILKGAGHHVYADRSDLFNSLVEAIASSVDVNSLPNYDKDLLARIQRVPSSTDSEVLDPNCADFDRPVGHGDENVGERVDAGENDRDPDCKESVPSDSKL